MYSYTGQGSPSVLSYQYGTERYVTNDSYLSGLGVESFDPYPQVHQPTQNDPNLHRQNIYRSGQMPMQRGQANLFPTKQGKGQSFASSNLDSYVVDKHSSTHNFSDLESLGYMHHSNSDEDQIKMLYRLGKFKDVQVKRYRYRVFENGLIQIISPSPFMVGRIISENKRPKLYHSILKSILEEQSMYGNPFLTVQSALTSAQKTADQVQETKEQVEELIDTGSEILGRNSSSTLSPAQLSVLRNTPLTTSLPLTSPTSSSAVKLDNAPLVSSGKGITENRFGSDEKSTIEKALMIAVPVGLSFLVYKLFFAKKSRKR